MDSIGQIFYNDGTKINNNFSVSTSGHNGGLIGMETGRQTHPNVADLYDGNFLVCWENEELDNVNGVWIPKSIYVQAYSTGGAKLGDPLQVESSLDMTYYCRMKKLGSGFGETPVLGRFIIGYEIESSGKINTAFKIYDYDRLKGTYTLKSKKDADTGRIYFSKTFTGFSSNINIENSEGVGIWGGECICPDGGSIPAGALEGQGCSQGACTNGTFQNCSQESGVWSNVAAVCGTDGGLRPDSTHDGYDNFGAVMEVYNVYGQESL